MPIGIGLRIVETERQKDPQRLARSVSRVLVLMFFGMAAIPVEAAEKPLDLSVLQNARRLSVVVYAISTQITFPVGLDTREFDRYIERPRVDYVLRISRAGLPRRTATIIADTMFEAESADASIDLRYRIDFKVADNLAISIYADPAGRLFHGGRVLEPTNGKNWLRAALEVVEADVLLKVEP
jgi:hypothetical protein